MLAARTLVNIWPSIKWQLYLSLNESDLSFFVDWCWHCLPLFSGISPRCSSEERSQESQHSGLPERQRERERWLIKAESFPVKWLHSFTITPLFVLRNSVLKLIRFCLLKVHNYIYGKCMCAWLCSILSSQWPTTKPREKCKDKVMMKADFGSDPEFKVKVTEL